MEDLVEKKPEEDRENFGYQTQTIDNAERKCSEVQSKCENCPDDFGDEDYFSRQPDVYLLQIFQKLSRREIFNATRVNKRTLPLYNDQSLTNIKWGGGKLHMFQTMRGYGFVLTIRSEGYPGKNSQRLSYQYEIRKSEGSFVESRKLSSTKFQGLIQHDNSRGLNWAVPEQYFEALAALLQHHEATDVEIELLPTDVFIRLAKIFAGHEIQSLKYFSMINQEENRENIADIRKNFTQIARDINHVDVRFSQQLFSVLNEEFFHGMKETMSRNRSLLMTSDLDLAFPHRFFPNESILPALAHLKVLETVSLVINANMVAPLIMARMGAMDDGHPDERGLWRIAVNQEITPDIISRTIREADYEHSFDDVRQYMRSKETDIQICFYPVLRDYNKLERAGQDILFIHF